MPTTTSHETAVAHPPPATPLRARAQAYARLITTVLLQPRRIHLKGRAPKDPRVHQLRRDINREHAKPAEMILRIQLADLDDGAPLASVLRFHEAAIVLLREYHDARRDPNAGGKPLCPIMRVETKLQYRVDDAQQRVLDDPNDVEALEALEIAWAPYQEQGAKMVDAVRERRLQLEAEQQLQGAVA